MAGEAGKLPDTHELFLLPHSLSLLSSPEGVLSLPRLALDVREIGEEWA